MYYKSTIVCGLRIPSRCGLALRPPPGGAGGRDRHPRVRGNALLPPKEYHDTCVGHVRVLRFVTKRRRAVSRARAFPRRGFPSRALRALLAFLLLHPSSPSSSSPHGDAADRTAVACTWRTEREQTRLVAELRRETAEPSRGDRGRERREAPRHPPVGAATSSPQVARNSRYAPIPNTDVLRSGTGTAGSKSASLRLCKPTSALFRPWNTPPVFAPAYVPARAPSRRTTPRACPSCTGAVDRSGQTRCHR